MQLEEETQVLHTHTQTHTLDNKQRRGKIISLFKIKKNSKKTTTTTTTTTPKKKKRIKRDKAKNGSIE